MGAPYYEDELVTLYLGDCLDVLPEITGVDLVVTSPPYNLAGLPWAPLGHWRPGGASGSGGSGKWVTGAHSGTGVAYSDHADDLPHEDYVAWQHEVLTACWGTLSDRGAIYYNHKPRVVGAHLWTPLELNPDLPLRQIIIWARSGGMNYSRAAYVPTHEWIMVLAKPNFRLRDQSASGVGDVWRINQDTANSHPAPFPLGIPARAIETTAPRVVLDPFAGSGTTLRAAATAGVRSIGIEKSEQYCEQIAKRLGQQAFDFGEWEA